MTLPNTAAPRHLPPFEALESILRYYKTDTETLNDENERIYAEISIGEVDGSIVGGPRDVACFGGTNISFFQNRHSAQSNGTIESGVLILVREYIIYAKILNLTHVDF